MLIQFPKNFIWGTSTAAPQIETAFDHDWVGVKSKDGFTFGRTSDHEKRRTEDLQYICQLGNAYRMSLDWSRLQREPYGKFVPEVVSEYRSFLAKLKARNKYIMLVLHHFANPNWFVRAGSWDSEKSIGMFTDYARQIVDNFGDMVDNWNTFNEPNVYLVNSRFIGNFPPFKKNIRAFWAAFNHISRAHKLTAKILKDRYPNTPVGISHNCVAFEAANFIGRLPAYIADKVFMETIPDRFLEGCDYWGMSYYARIPLAPFPVTEVDTPGKLAEWGRPHDKMWQYYPEGMKESVLRYHDRYKLPIIITESGICTDDSQVRINSIKQYLGLLHECIAQGVDLRGYFHWTTLDNFEWNLGPTYRFGLVHVNFDTGERTMKPCGEFYKQVVAQGGF